MLDTMTWAPHNERAAPDRHTLVLDVHAALGSHGSQQIEVALPCGGDPTCSRVRCVIGIRLALRVLDSTLKLPTTLPIFIFSSSLRHSRCLCMSRRISRIVLSMAS